MKKFNKLKIQLAYIFIFFGTALFGCKKWIEIDPPVSSINSENIYSKDITAIGVLNGLYVNLVTSGTGTSTQNLSYRTSLSSDELTLNGGVSNESLVVTYQNRLFANQTNSYGGEIWTRYFNFIFTCNSAIDGISKSQTLSSSVKQQLLGEAKFIKAFCYFYLVNLYGELPIITSTDPEINYTIQRSPINMVYEQIIKDLKEAQSLLSSNFLNKDLIAYQASAIERIRPTKWAASALLARTYLYAKEYANAEAEAGKLISETSLFGMVGLNQAFLSNNREAIWQLQPVRTGRNSEDAFLFILPSSGPTTTTSNPVFLSSSLLAAFEPGDGRAINGNWIKSLTTTNGITYYYPFKYKLNTTSGSATEYPVVLRLSEQYLIRAEARAKQGRVTGSNSAQSDLNVVRNRAGLPNTTVTNEVDMLNAILKERRVEFFTEWGHRWLDIKRVQVVNDIMTQEALRKGTTWEAHQQLYPLPFREVETFLKQNIGY